MTSYRQAVEEADYKSQKMKEEVAHLLDVAKCKTLIDVEDLIVVMRKDIEFLACLRRAGVDNWDGFSDAAQEYNEGRE